MICDRKKRQTIRSYIIISSIALSIVLLIITIIGIYNIRLILVENSIKTKQLQEIDLNDAKYPSANNDIDNVTSSKQKDDMHQRAPMVAILLSGLGLSERITQMSIMLPGEISLGFYSNAASTYGLLRSALNRGHEIYLSLPISRDIELDNTESDLIKSDDEDLKKFEHLLSGFNEYAGLYSNIPDIYMQNAFKDIQHVSTKKNLLFVLLAGSSEKNMNLDNASRFIFADIYVGKEEDKIAINKALLDLIMLAKSNGSAAGYIETSPLVINALMEWMPSLLEHGVELVPISSLKGR